MTGYDVCSVFYMNSVKTRFVTFCFGQMQVDNVFTPLGMTETTFNPSTALKKRAAATEQRNGQWIKGEVHDPRAHLLQGVAGHAGLFSTADDLTRYGQQMLRIAKGKKSTPLSQATFKMMTRPRDVRRDSQTIGTRTYGWLGATFGEHNSSILFYITN